VAPPAVRSGHGLVRCPVCRLDLAAAPGSLVCPNRHSFDLAREGYVNLLRGGRHQPGAGGDTSAQLEHRRAFLGSGHFDAITSVIARHAARRWPGLAFAVADLWAEWPVRVTATVTRLIGPTTTVRYRREVTVDGPAVRAAIMMGPNAHHIGPAVFAADVGKMAVTFDIAIVLAERGARRRRRSRSS
jgi:hypothetical protein